MAHRSQCSSAGDNPLDPNYLPPHYREEYRMAIDALVDGDLDGYYGFLQEANVVNFLSQTEIDFIKCMVRAPHRTSQSERRYMAEDGDGSSDTYWPVHSDIDAPSLDLGWPQQLRFVGPTEVTTLVNPPDPEMPSIKVQVRRMIKNAQQVVAVVMDMFTDVDIFADILNATMRGVAVYILLDELNAHHFVSMVNNCRVNLDEIKLMRVRTVPGTTYFCHTGKSFKGQMMDRFILVDCRAVLTGNYSFTWSFEKIHRCLAHLFLGQLVTTFDEEFRILFAHSELLNVEKVLANMSQYSNIHEGHLHMEKTHMFNREFPNMLPERAGHYPEDHMNVSDKMLPFRNIEPTNQPFRESHPFMEQGRQMRGPMEMVGFKRHGYPDVPDYGYMPPQNQPAMRSKQFMEGVVPKGGHFAREPGFYQGGLQPEYDQYGRFRGQGHHIDQYPGAGYPPEVNEPEPPGAYDHVQRYLQSQPPVEEGHGARNLLSPAQSNPRRHSMGQSYACQTSPTQPNLPDQKRFFNANRKPQDVSQKQGLRDWRISSYLSAYDDGEDMDFPELEGSDLSDNVPCFVPEAPGGPMGAEIRPGTIEFNKMMPPSRNNPPFIQIRNSSPPLGSDHPPDFTEMIKMPFVIKTPPTSESSCTTEGDKVEETQMRKPKEINLFGEEFLRSKPTRAVQRSSRLRHSLIFSSNLELNTSQDPKDALGENDEDEASKLSARVSQIMDKRRSCAREPFQWSNFVRSATVDDQTIESARSETSLNKIGVDSDVGKVDSQGPAQEKTLPETQSTVLEDKRDESNVWQRSSLMDMNDPDCRLRYFKELAAKRKAELAAAQTSQSNADKAPKKSEAPEKSSTRDGGNKAALTTPVIQDAKCRNEESSEDILHRATDAEKIRIKKKLAEESLQKDTAPTLNPALKKSAESQKSTQKQISTLSGKSSQPVTSSPSKPCSRNVEALSVPAPAETSLSQNQVDSNVLSTALSKTTHIPKETGFSNVVLKESGPPLNIAPNESSQTPAQKPPHILTPISNIVAADSSLIQNRDIVNTLPESKLINTDPSLAISTAASSVSLSATGENVSQKLITPKAESSQQSITKGEETHKHSALEADASQRTTASENEPVQQPTPLKTDSLQHPTKTEEDSSQKPTAAKSASSPNLPATETDSSQKPTVVKKESSQHLSATESATTQTPTAVESKSFQHPAAKDANSFQQPTATENKHAPKSPAAVADSFQHPTSAETDSSQQPNALEVKSIKLPTATENEHAQKTSATETDDLKQNEHAQKPIAMETEALQHTLAKENEQTSNMSVIELESLQHPLATENEQAQTSIALETEALQHFPATENKDVQNPTAMKVDSSQQSTTVGVSSSVISTATVTKHPQKPTETEKPLGTENEPEQKSDATEGESFQHPDTTDSFQQLTKSEVQSSQIPTATDSSQHPTEIKSELVQKSTSDQGDCFQQSTETEPDSSRKSSTEADVSQQVTAQETQSSELPKEADSLQKPSASEGDSSQLPSATKTEPSQHSTETDSFKEPTESLDISHNPTGTITDLSSKSTGTDKSPPNLTPLVLDASKHPNSTECESVQHPADTKCVSASPHTLKVTLSPQTISFSDTIPADSHLLFQTGSVSTSTIETNTDENILITTVCTIQSEVKAERESKVVLPTSEIQETSLATSEQKDDNVCQDVSKQESILTTNVTSEENISSQGIIITAKPTSEKPCPQTDDGKMELNSSLEKAQANASTSAVNNDDASLNSNEIHDSPESSTQTDTSSAQESNSLNDPKPEDELHKHEESVPTTTERNQTTPAVENSVTNLTDVSEKSESIATPNSAENAKSQSAVTENPKPIPSAHQSSTANVISCSNLRDDTKVLLEQISAKNQRTKQTPAAANEEKEGGVKSAGQQPSSFPGRPWSSKASTEEKEMLLQKMEKMRKERKVYSRFEAS